MGREIMGADRGSSVKGVTIMIRWRIWLSYYEKPDRPNNDEMWRRRFPVTVVAQNEGDAFEEAVKIAHDLYDRNRFSVAVMTSENRGLAYR
jgi:hypothetical protein